MATPFDLDAWHMQRALELAFSGQGWAEPNPLVGCVVAQGAEAIGLGYHRRFGGPHAEVEALAVAGSRARGATLVVTLEPCCHWGKTPPCTKAILAAGIRRVVVAQSDPFPAVQGGGLAELRAAGLEVRVGVLEAEAHRLNAPYLKLLATGRPWLIGKWAMTLDGRIATRTGSSQWISNAASRDVVQDLRGRVDAIMVGRGTAQADDPLLTARGEKRRTATRIVVDSRLALRSDSQLARTAREVPVLVATGPEAPTVDRARLEACGCEVFVCPGASPAARLGELLDELGRRRMTNVLVEGGQQLLGSLFDAGQLDEAHVFIAPKLVGGSQAFSPVGGSGAETLAQAWHIDRPVVKHLGDDLYVSGQLVRPAVTSG